MLTRSRLATLTALALAVAAATGTTAPAASASPASVAVVPMAHFPAGAGRQLAREMTQAWQITRGHGVTIAVLSTAVDPVTGLAGKLIHGPDYAPLAGASAVDGTLLASLIAGSGPTGTDPFGTIGRAPGARILVEQVADFGSHGGGKYDADGTWQRILARAIRYAADHGAGVIVTDSAGGTDAPELDSAVQYAISKNAVVLGSASATTRKKPTPLAYPDSLPGVINVAGVTLSGLPKPQGPDTEPANDSVLIAVPNNTLAATGPGNNPYTAWGYYSDLAWAAGTVALIKAVYPQITPAEVARALAESASYHPRGGYSITAGFGLINPVGALHDAAALVKLGTTATPGSGTVSSTSRFGTAQPAAISAVHHMTAKLAGYGGAVVIGLVLLVLALILGRRRRRRRKQASVLAAGLPATTVL